MHQHPRGSLCASLCCVLQEVDIEHELGIELAHDDDEEDHDEHEEDKHEGTECDAPARLVCSAGVAAAV